MPDPAAVLDNPFDAPFASEQQAGTPAPVQPQRTASGPPESDNPFDEPLASEKAGEEQVEIPSDVTGFEASGQMAPKSAVDTGQTLMAAGTGAILLGGVAALEPEALVAAYKVSSDAVKAQMIKHPYIAAAVGGEIYNVLPPWAKRLINPGSILGLIGKFGGGAAAEAEAGPVAAAEKEAVESVAKPTMSTANLEEELSKGLGGKPLQPSVPLRSQGAAPEPVPQGQALPKGFEPHDSSVIKASHYNPDTQELTVIDSKTGQSYSHGEVSPSEYDAFKNSSSKGKAWNAIRQNHVLTKKNGIPIRPQGRSSEDYQSEQ
jgi:hypothetical protein